MSALGLRRARPGLSPPGLVAVLVGAALVTWAVSLARMRGMDAGPGTDLGGLGAFVALWVTMMAAMMLPSVAPTVLVFARVAAARGRVPGATALFVAGYLAAWTAFGLVAYAIAAGLDALDPAALAWDAQGPLVAGGAIAAAGLYQLTPLKRACLRHCRSPLGFVLARSRPGRPSALRLGAEHGTFCVGCCWGLMLVLFAVGLMSLVWMALVAAVIFVEKVLPIGERAGRGVALALVALGLWVALAPGTVPGLTEPDAAPTPMGM